MEPSPIEWHFDHSVPSSACSVRRAAMTMNDVASRVHRQRFVPIELSVNNESTDVKVTSVDSGVETGNDSNDGAAASSSRLLQSVNTENMKQFVLMTNVKSPTIVAHRAQSDADDMDKPQSSLSADTDDDSHALRRFNTVPPVKNFLQCEPSYLKCRLPFSGKMVATCLKGRRNSGFGNRIRISRFGKNDAFYASTLRRERRMRLAAATNNIDVIRLILDKGISPNNSDEQGRTPLHFASGRGYTEIVDLLLKHGADANRTDCIGNTPLHLAAVASKISVVTLLLEAGTDPLSPDYHGYNPLQLAESKLRLLQNCKGEDMIGIKSEVRNVVNMLTAFLKNRQGFGEQVESLSTICSRLTLSNTSDQVKNEVEGLLTSIDYLQLNS